MPDAPTAPDHTDLEARLRIGLADLVASAPDPGMRGVDLDAPLRAHRHRFERRRRFVVGAAATTAAAGIGAVVVLTRGDEPQLTTGMRVEPQVDVPPASRWVPIETAPLSPRSAPLIAAVDGRLAVWSGASPSVPNSHPPDGSIWSPRTESWTPMADAPAGAVAGDWVSGPVPMGSRVSGTRSFAEWDGSQLIVGLTEADSAAPWNADVGPAWEARYGIAAYAPDRDEWRYLAPIDAAATSANGLSWQAVTVPGGLLVSTRAASPLQTGTELIHVNGVSGETRPLPLGPFEKWDLPDGSGVVDLVAVGDLVVATTEWDPRPWIFDVTSETWRQASAPPQDASGLALMTSIGDRAAVRLGGSADVQWIFDPRVDGTEAWRPVASNPFTPTPWEFRPVWSGSELFVPGAAYDPATDAWREVPGPDLADPIRRHGVHAVWIAGGLALFGGLTTTECEGGSCRYEREILDGWFLPAP